MCGIVGYIKRGDLLDRNTFLSMRDSLAHRGPDDAGSWDSPENGVALGSRRLAILDLSPQGHQPMHDHTGDLTIVFNGEIYNCVELRKQLRKVCSFRSSTDTEVLLAAYNAWGTDCLRYLNGMFAFAIWDARQHQLFAARDRFGEKPFYYFHQPGLFLFASEIKALLASNLVPAEPNLRAIYRYLAYRETDAFQETFFEGITSLPPSQALLYSPGSDSFKTWQYWDLNPDFQVRHSSDQGYAEHFLSLLQDSVKIRLRSDVPVGSCLSGGLDSSSIVALMSSQLNGNAQHTFSARFADPHVDEGAHIQCVVDHFSLANHTTYPDPLRMVEEMDHFVWHQEHPFAAGSIYAQWCVMKLAKEHGVTVLLDGQGGDEGLAGYLNSFGAHCSDLYRDGRWSPLAKAIRARAAQSGLSSMGGLLASHLPASLRQFATGIYEPLSLQPDFVRSSYCPPTSIRPRFASSLHNELYRQVCSSMLPKLLRFADRSSMAFSVEVRLPFLDHRVIDFLFAIPEDQKIRGSLTKFILRNAMRSRVPAQILNRTDKKGFETPQAAWLRGPLRQWAEDLFFSSDFKQRGWIDVASAQRLWKQFLSHHPRHHGQLFRWLSLESWAKTFLKPTRAFVRSHSPSEKLASSPLKRIAMQGG